MTRALDPYRGKRDFAATPEPRGKVARRKAQALSFVIQKHAARRLHYDFRLELDGTLKSWAVPKGPSFDPHERRLAVHVEDHPLDYADFEGVIPPQHYGAGTVIVWDRGEWIPHGDPREGYRAGKLKFELRGEKLHGLWTLVRMRGRGNERQEPWLLIKERDELARPLAEYDVTVELPDSVLSKPWPGRHGRSEKAALKKPKLHTPRSKSARSAAAMPAGAVKAPLPMALAPQLATLVDAVPAGDEWIYEVKYDGYRLLARLDGDDVRLFTRNGNDWSGKLKSLRAELAQWQLGSAWLDGELVAFDSEGVADFQRLQNAFDQSQTRELAFYVFDMPYYNGYDLRAVPLLARHEWLRKVLAGVTSEHVRLSEYFSVKADELLTTACKMRLEGLIGKRIDAPYTSTRSRAWIKLKCSQRQEFVIGGFTDPQNSRTGFGALLVGIHEPDGSLRYAGKVGTGFTRESLRQLTAKLKSLEIEQTPFEDLAGRRSRLRAHWVKPALMAEISFAEWTDDGHIRQGVFHGLRSDKPARAITQEQPLPVAAAERTATAPRRQRAAATPALPQSRRARTSAKAKVKGAGAAVVAGIAVSHPERVIDPVSQFTKLDLVRYYESVAALILPHLRDRPVSLVRAPAGVGGELFFQKHADKLEIPHSRQLDPALDPGHPPLLAVDSVTALIGAAQMNTIELHTWNATARAIETPDRITFDLDPGEGFSWQRMREATLMTKALLDELGLASFLKTSGGKGLHIVVPLKPAAEWDTVRQFAQSVARYLAQLQPRYFAAKSGPRNRVGKVFVDYLRNGRGATTAAAFTARARPGLGVSVPVAWDELPAIDSGAHWTVATLHERLAKLRTDPWAGYTRTRQTLDRALRNFNSDPAPAARRAAG